MTTLLERHPLPWRLKAWGAGQSLPPECAGAVDANGACVIPPTYNVEALRLAIAAVNLLPEVRHDVEAHSAYHGVTALPGCKEQAGIRERLRRIEALLEGRDE